MKNTLGGFFQIRQEHLAIGACHLKEQKETPLAGGGAAGREISQGRNKNANVSTHRFWSMPLF